MKLSMNEMAALMLVLNNITVKELLIACVHGFDEKTDARRAKTLQISVPMLLSPILNRFKSRILQLLSKSLDNNSFHHSYPREGIF